MGSVTEERRKENDKSVFFTESKSALRTDIAKIIVFDVISILAYLMFTCWLTVFFSDAGTAVFFTLSAAADVFILYAFIKRARKNMKALQKLFVKCRHLNMMTCAVRQKNRVSFTIHCISLMNLSMFRKICF